MKCLLFYIQSTCNQPLFCVLIFLFSVEYITIWKSIKLVGHRNICKPFYMTSLFWQTFVLSLIFLIFLYFFPLLQGSMIHFKDQSVFFLRPAYIFLIVCNGGAVSLKRHYIPQNTEDSYLTNPVKHRPSFPLSIFLTVPMSRIKRGKCPGGQLNCAEILGL